MTLNFTLAFDNYVNPMALSAIKWKDFNVYIATLSVVIVIIWFYFPQIKGLTIEEISFLSTNSDERTARRLPTN